MSIERIPAEGKGIEPEANPFSHRTGLNNFLMLLSVILTTAWAHAAHLEACGTKTETAL
jgi:hypothetical protein